jgi:hypothetical protein
MASGIHRRWWRKRRRSERGEKEQEKEDIWFRNQISNPPPPSVQLRVLLVMSPTVPCHHSSWFSPTKTYCLGGTRHFCSSLYFFLPDTRKGEFFCPPPICLALWAQKTRLKKQMIFFTDLTEHHGSRYSGSRAFRGRECVQAANLNFARK